LLHLLYLSLIRRYKSEFVQVIALFENSKKLQNHLRFFYIYIGRPIVLLIVIMINKE